MSTGVLLAGGQHDFDDAGESAGPSSGALPIQEVLDVLATVVDDVVITTGPDQPLPLLRCRLPVVVCEDLLPGRGPLAGILTGLQCARSDYALVVACDAPLLKPDLLRDLLACRHGYDAVVPVAGHRTHPLPAVYRKTCIPALERTLNGEDLSVTAFVRSIRTCLLDEQRVRAADPELRSFVHPGGRSRRATPTLAPLGGA